MKKLIIIALTCYWASPGIAQDIKVVGSGQMPDNQVKKADSKENSPKQFDATIRCYYTFTQSISNDGPTTRIDTMSLLIGNTQSKFYNPAKYQRDSLFASVLTNLNPATIQSISIMKDEGAPNLSDYPGVTSSTNSNDGESYQIFKDRTSHVITYIDYVNGMMKSDSYQYEDKLESAFNWKTDPETSLVLNYSCQKATLNFRGRDYIAWFTPDIPINDGPWKFMGLPGLIMKIYDTKQMFSFELIGIETFQSPVSIPYDEGKFKCSRKQFADQKKKQNAGTQININGGNVTISETPRKFEYNPMELSE